MSRLNSLKSENLPSSWRLLPVGRVLLDSQYGTNEPAVEGGNTRVIGMKDIQNGKVITDDLTSSNLPEEERAKYLLIRGDLLINRTNSYDLVGKVGIFKSDEKVAFASYLVRLKIDKTQIRPEYLNYWLNCHIAQTVIKKIATRAISQANINPTEFKKHCLVPLPPLIEQTVISDLLSTWVTAIEKTELLIAAKEKRFSWLLNRMINEESIQSEWKWLKLGEIVEINKGQQLNVSDMVDSGRYYALNGGIEPSGFTNHWNTNENTITISEGGNSCGFVNFNTEKFWCGGHCYALNNLKNGVDNRYLYNFLKHHEKSLMLLRVGSGLPNIQKKDIQRYLVTFPLISQQKQIATILDTALHEIELLKKQANAYRQQKHGLVQKLLTGQWRVKMGVT